MKPHLWAMRAPGAYHCITCGLRRYRVTGKVYVYAHDSEPVEGSETCVVSRLRIKQSVERAKQEII